MLPVIIFRELFPRVTYLLYRTIRILLIIDPFQKRETTMYKKIIGLLCVALMVTVVGCGSSHPPLTVVTGTVTYDGEPLADATVAVMPDGGDGTAKPADGKTDKNGNFTLVTTFPDGGIVDGAVEGDYTLRVVKYEAVEMPTDEGEPPADGADPASEMMAMMGDDLDVSNPSLINEVFGLAYSTNTGWKNNFTVGAIESPTTLKITLSSDGSGKIE